MTEASIITGDEIFAVASSCLEHVGISMAMDASKNDDIKGQEVFEEFLEMMPPAVLFHGNILANQSIYKLPREHVRMHGLDVRKERGLPITGSPTELPGRGVQITSQNKWLMERRAAQDTYSPSQLQRATCHVEYCKVYVKKHRDIESLPDTGSIRRNTQ